MNALRVNDDFFSPIRFDSSVVESSEGSDVDISNSDCALADNVIKIRRQSEVNLDSNDQNIKNVESASIFIPDKEPSTLLNAKKVDKTKCLGRNAKEEHFSKNVGRLKQRSKKMINVPDCHSPELETEKFFSKKSSRSISSSKEHNMKNVKMVEKSTTHSLKNICVDDEHDLKYCPAEKLFDKTLDNKKNASILKFKDEKMIVPKERNAAEKENLAKEKSNVMTQEAERVESTADAQLYEYEAPIEKLIHDCVGYECSKIRQNMYMQQITFYRQINKIKVEMEQQHSATCKHLFQVIEELKRINSTLQ